MALASWFRSRKKTGDLLQGLAPDDVAHIEKLLARLDDVPGDLRARKQLGDAFKRVNRVEDAVAQYQALAGAYAAQGLLFKAISACKQVLELVPEHEATTRTLAELYARRTAGKESAELSDDMALALVSDDDIEEVRAPPAPSVESGAPVSVDDAEVVALPPPVPDDEEAEIIDVTALAASMTPLAAGAVRLERPPAVPLFSGLSAASFATLVKKLDAWEAEPGAVIVGEGEESDSVFVVVRGRVRVERGAGEAPTVLAHLGPDSFFGEMALLTRRPRTASVIAEGKVELLEISRAVFRELVVEDPAVSGAVESFCRARILDGLARTSPLLRDLPKEIVDEALAAFTKRDAKAGEALVRQGEPGPGLFLVLQGDVDVTARTEIGDVRVKRLGPGDVFGEMSLLADAPATATVTAASDVAALLLPREAFAGFARAHPPLSERLAQVAAERRAFNERHAIAPLEDATSSAVLV